MPVVCGSCGSSNRDNAKFCIGCAGRLPGFAPTRPSALDAVLSASAGVRAPLAPAPARGRRPWRRDDPLALLPAETPAFWLRLGLAGVAMGLVFFAWYLYVTRSVAAPAAPSELTAALETTDRRPAAVPAQKAPAQPDAPARNAAPAPGQGAPAAASSASPAATAPTRSLPAPAARAEPPAKAPAATAAPAQPEFPTIRGASAAPPERRRSEAPRTERPPRAPARTEDQDVQPAVAAAAPTMPWIRPPGWTREDTGMPAVRAPATAPATATAPAPVVAPRGQGWNRGDGGPPIAPGPGPVYNYGSPGSSTGGDADPPVVPGPGPQFNARRGATVAADDSGPPVARGPGPVYNWTSTRER